MVEERSERRVKGPPPPSTHNVHNNMSNSRVNLSNYQINHLLNKLMPEIEFTKRNRFRERRARRCCSKGRSGFPQHSSQQNNTQQ